MKPHILLLALLAACQGPETGINNTIINGVVEIPPIAVTEQQDAGNDDWETAEALPGTSYRVLVVDGNVSSFAGATGKGGDVDAYTFVPEASGDMTFSLVWPDGSAVDFTSASLDLGLYDLTDPAAPVEVATATTDTGAGVGPSFTATVTSGVTYGIQMTANQSGAESAPYQLVVAGLDPNAAGFVVGAYMTDDPLNHGNPVGGGQVKEFSLAADYTWRGDFTIMYLHLVGSCLPSDQACIDAILNTTDATPSGAAEASGKADTGDTGTEPVDTGTGPTDTGTGPTDTGTGPTDTGEGPADTGNPCGGTDTATDTGGEVEGEQPQIYVNETINSVYLIAATLDSLNMPVMSGDFYSTEPVLVDTSANTTIGADENPDDSAAPEDLVVVTADATMPTLVGWEYAEQEPNDYALSGSNYYPIDEAVLLEVANDLGMASGSPYTDYVTGSLLNAVDVTDWGQGDADIYAIEVPSTMGMTVQIEWDDPSLDIDMIMYIWWQCELVPLTDAATTVDPESVSPDLAYGLYLEPGQKYYFAVLGYTVPAGEVPYRMTFSYR